MQKSSIFQEIEYKFLPKNLPFDLDQTCSIHCERYYLYVDQNSELRIQKKGKNTYEIEYKIQEKESPILRASTKIKITKDVFNGLKNKIQQKNIIYQKYKTPNENMFIKKYEKDFAGLILLEIEFENLKLAHSFKKEKWMGEDISTTPFAKDSGLINFASFQDIKNKFSNIFK